MADNDDISVFFFGPITLPKVSTHGFIYSRNFFAHFSFISFHLKATIRNMTKFRQQQQSANPFAMVCNLTGGGGWGVDDSFFVKKLFNLK